jgi:transposase
MIDYETYLKIHHLAQVEKLKSCQIARRLDLHEQTVAAWLLRPTYQARKSQPRGSKLDPFKSMILRWIDQHDYSAQQILEKLRFIGYAGGRTILTDYLREVRPKPQPAFLKLHFEPGECAQVDWGECGKLQVGSQMRKLHVFVMVLCHSRLLFLHFYLSQGLECFLDGHRRALEFFAGVPRRIMLDNLKTGVLEHRRGELPEYHPRYLDLARHYGFSPVACNVAKGNEKGRVERGVGYVKGNFLSGRPLHDICSLQAAADQWRDQVANQRVHGTTRQPPRLLFEQAEKEALLWLRAESYDCAVHKQAYLSKDCRIQFETNTYSVPPGSTRKTLSLRIYPEKIEIYGKDLGAPIASHARCYDRRQDIEEPAHTRQLKEQRRQAREQNLQHDFRALGKAAVDYFEKLQDRHLDYRSQLRRLLTLAEIHGQDKLLRALEDNLEHGAVHVSYVERLLHARDRMSQLTHPHPLHLTRKEDLLELRDPEHDLEIYDPPSPSINAEDPPDPQANQEPPEQA